MKDTTFEPAKLGQGSDLIRILERHGGEKMRSGSTSDAEKKRIAQTLWILAEIIVMEYRNED